MEMLMAGVLFGGMGLLVMLSPAVCVERTLAEVSARLREVAVLGMSGEPLEDASGMSGDVIEDILCDQNLYAMLYDAGCARSNFVVKERTVSSKGVRWWEQAGDEDFRRE
jgi:hypothetical protein